MPRAAAVAAIAVLLHAGCSAGATRAGGASADSIDHASPAADSVLAPVWTDRLDRADRADHDTLGVRFEAGASSDVSSERFYEDAFLDSVALGLKRVDSPESRFAAVWHASLAGTRDARGTSYRLENELSWGDLVRSDLLSLDWRRVTGNDWRWAVSPRAELRRDRTFGRDLEQRRAAASARLARMFPTIESTLELTGQGEGLRTRGSGADFIPDRNAAGLRLSFGREPLSGPEWRVGAGATRRVFPDTSARDHVEQHAEASWHSDLTGGHRLDLAADASRRSTLHDAPTSQDRYREGGLDGTLELSVAPLWTTAFHGRLESLRYDAHDTTGFFDYDIARAEFTPRWANGAWTVRAGPRIERLSSATEPSESYTELVAELEVERFATGWWTLGPSYGYRRYRETFTTAPALGAVPVLASRASFACVQLDVLGEQPLPLRTRCRLFASGRIEQHSDPAQDARSLYISLDVRRLF